MKRTYNSNSADELSDALQKVALVQPSSVYRHKVFAETQFLKRVIENELDTPGLVGSCWLFLTKKRVAERLIHPLEPYSYEGFKFHTCGTAFGCIVFRRPYGPPPPSLRPSVQVLESFNGYNADSISRDRVLTLLRAQKLTCTLHPPALMYKRATEEGSYDVYTIS